MLPGSTVWLRPLPPNSYWRVWYRERAEAFWAGVGNFMRIKPRTGCEYLIENVYTFENKVQFLFPSFSLSKSSRIINMVGFLIRREYRLQCGSSSSLNITSKLSGRAVEETAHMNWFETPSDTRRSWSAGSREAGNRITRKQFSWDRLYNYPLASGSYVWEIDLQHVDQFLLTCAGNWSELGFADTICDKQKRVALYI